MGDDIGFLAAGYALTWVVLGWYALRLSRRVKAATRALEELREEPEAAAGTAGEARG
ncbi:MAG: LapA family protein [Gemmatimonadota bacterium]